MAKRGWVIVVAAALALGGAAVATRDMWSPEGAVAQAPTRPAAQERRVPVEVAVAIRKPVPVQLEALGRVTPMASVAIKARLETEITEVHFTDGASVNAGDLLFTLDGRSLEAQILQAEGVLARDKAQLEGAERDVQRFVQLLAKNAGTQVSVDNAKTQTDMLRGTVKADESVLRNLRVQLGYTKIHAPISGRISAAAVKAGNFVRPADAVALATINQMKPVYVTFPLPQRTLGEVRAAMQAGNAKVESLVPGEGRPSSGVLAMIDNSVDATTGMVSVRAVMDNVDEALWPGSLVNTHLTLRIEDVVAVPAVAVQTSQTGTFVFVVRDGAASVRPVTVARTVEGEAVIASGLADGETVVLDGQLLLTEGTKVEPRPSKAGS